MYVIDIERIQKVFLPRPNNLKADNKNQETSNGDDIDVYTFHAYLFFI